MSNCIEQSQLSQPINQSSEPDAIVWAGGSIQLEVDESCFCCDCSNIEFISPCQLQEWKNSPPKFIWTSDNPRVALPTAEGLVYGYRSGIAVIKVQLEGCRSYGYVTIGVMDVQATSLRSPRIGPRIKVKVINPYHDEIKTQFYK